jgi:hypothetical protein
MHYHNVEDESGDLVDVVPFCSDSCNRDYCAKHGLTYQGWNGCQEGPDSPMFCASCGVYAGGAAQCEHQRDNVLVNRFHTEHGEKCPCSNWIQVPAATVERFAHATR